DAQHEAGIQTQHDYAAAQQRVQAMQSAGGLGEAEIFEFAKAGRFADLIAGLAALCATPLPLIENLLQSASREAILIPCKAAGLDWPTVRLIMSSRSVGGAISEQDIDAARTDYFKLSRNNAQRVLRFWQVRHSATDNAAAPTP